VNIGALIFSSIGSILVVIGAVFAVVRAILRMVDATRENTAALVNVQTTLLSIGVTLNEHTTDIAILKDRNIRGGTPNAI